jgi:hypothetical protein
MDLNVITTEDAVTTVGKVKADPAAAAEIADPKRETAAGKVPEVTADDLYSRLLKYIPGPQIGIYLFVTNAVYGATDDDKDPSEALLWIVLVFFLAATVAWLVRRGVKRLGQIVVSVLAFVAFATASPGPFQLISGWDALYGTLAIAGVAVVMIVFQPGELPTDGE